MGFSDVFEVLKALILDWRVIAAFAIVFLYLNFVFYVSKYKKKQVFKQKRVVKQKEAPPTTQGENEGSGETAPADTEDDDLV